MNGNRRTSLIALAAALAALTLAPAAGAAKHHKPKKLIAPAKVSVGRVALGRTTEGGPAILVAIRYPIQALGRELSANIRLAIPGRDFHSIVTDRLSAGPLQRGDGRRTFSFVHQFSLHPRVAAAVAKSQAEGRPVKVTATADAAIDVDGDGKPDLSSHDTRAAVLPPARLMPATGSGKHPDASARAAAKPGKPFCASFPQLRLNPGQRVEYPLPACSRPVEWKLARPPRTGTAFVRPDSLVIKATKKPGRMEIPLASGATVQVTVTGAPQVSVRAIGDSVTAGYGYYSDGSQMPIYRLPECKPFGAHLNDACSSNATSTYETGKEEPVPYAPDYGLANNVSWAAQWANANGVTNYENLAVTGSEPKNWAPGGSLYATTKGVEAEDPDYILMTMGANPILAETLFGLDPMACAIYADIYGEYSRCVEKAFAKVNLRPELHRLYADLVEHSTSTMYLMQYHLSIPSTALAYTSTQIAEMVVLMNQTIAEVAAELDPTRLQVIAPPHFDSGLNLEPLEIPTYECGDLLTDHVDGPSVQSTVTQDELGLLHPLEFCPQTEGEAPWVISGDTGIHPSAEGYFHMAARIPAPR